tara:strand:- start:1730 stop:2275 length:546 start_codon:yes stop_codon:yes gene_type:complete
MEFETYEEVIDSYNSGVGVEAGESLTDYIKRNNIKIKEIEMDPIGDLEKILREGKAPMENEGIMKVASSNKDMNIDIETVVQEFIKRKKRRPRSIEEIKDFYMQEMSGLSGAGNRDNVSLASYDPSKYDPTEIEMYENYKYEMNEQRPGMPIIDIDEFLRLEKGQASVDLARGGLAGILGA